MASFGTIHQKHRGINTKTMDGTKPGMMTVYRWQKNMTLLLLKI